jgi:PAS domain S-box-containing protein
MPSKDQISIADEKQKANGILVVDEDTATIARIQSILSSKYKVYVASDMNSALNQIENHRPCLILCAASTGLSKENDLLSAVKRNKKTSWIPVIIISESFAQEDSVGSEMLADDYILKPISSKALLARVGTQLKVIGIENNFASQLKNVFDQSPMAIAMLSGPELIIEQANHLALDMWGKSREEVLNKPILEALPEIEGQDFYKSLTNVYNKGIRFVSTEHPVTLRRNGKLEERYVSFLYEPLRNLDGKISGAISIANDVTELVIARTAALDYAEVMEAQVAHRVRELVEKNRQIGEQKEFAEAIINSSIVLISVLDLETKVLAFNNKCEEAFGVKKEDVLGHNFLELFPSIKGTVTHDNINRAIRGETVHNELYKSTINGRYYESFTTPLRSQNGVVYAIIMTAHDISLAVESSEKLRQSNQELIRKNDELEQFAYISSHDLQEPLRKIQTFAELVSSNISNESLAKRYLAKIEKSASRMSALIKAVLAYSSISKTDNHLEIVNLNHVIESVKEVFESQIEEKNAIINYQNLPTIVGNQLQMHQLFANLISNALKFSEKDPIINFTTTQLSKMDREKLDLNPNIEYVKINIQDNGIGFEQQYADRIFTIFQRLNNRIDYEGTGIGLALCKKIVDNHQGSIMAESKPGEGSNFIICLPA